MHEHYGVLTHVCLSIFLTKIGVHIDYNVDKISYDDFINRELILFSHAGDLMSCVVYVKYLLHLIVVLIAIDQVECRCSD